MSPNARWTDVDRYVTDLFSLLDRPLARGLARSEAAGLPSIQVSPPEGRFLEILLRLRGARRVLEVGTLGGFSTTFLARAVGPSGTVVSLEIDPDHARVARENLREAGVEARVEIRVGDGHETLQAMRTAGEEPFDAIILDAEKGGYPDYLRATLELAAPGALLFADNAVWNGDILEADSDDPDIEGLRAFNAAVAAHPGVTATIIQTVGGRGWDGFLLGVVD